MRLICPNCGAHYSVDDRLIPETGREVQCSSCGDTWFQRHPDADPALAEELAETPPPHGAAQPTPRRAPDPAALSVLREEAARERAAREAERTALEVQSDFDLPPPARRTPRFADDSEETAVAVAVTRRRTLLPDIEEINSTLAPSEEPRAQVGVSERVERTRRKTGQRLGFGLAVALFAAATVVYLKGPSIGTAVPAFKPPLDAYVAAVDNGRRWIDTALRRAAEAATGLPDLATGES